MQSYQDIPDTTTLTASRSMLLNNILTAMSCSSGTAFPTTNLQVGMLCLRTDQNKLYQLKNTAPTWVMIVDLNINNALTPVGGSLNIDANTITRSGFYHCNANIPTNDGESDKAVIHNEYGIGNWATQIAQSWRNGRIWIRNKENGTWEPWFELLTANSGVVAGTSADMVDGRHAGNASGNIPINNGTVNTNLNADMVDGFHAGNASGNIPINNGTVNTNLNADMVDGFHASQSATANTIAVRDASGSLSGNVLGVSSGIVGVYNQSHAYLDQHTTTAPAFATASMTGSAYSPVAKIRTTGASRVRTVSFGALHNKDNTIDAVIHCITAGGTESTSWVFKNNGDFISPGNVVGYSDARLKEGIEPLTGALDALLKIKGVRFTWKNVEPVANRAGKKDIGVLASDVEPQFPEAVSRGAKIGHAHYKTVAYDRLIPVLIEAIRELRNEIEELKARVSHV